MIIRNKRIFSALIAGIFCVMICFSASAAVSFTEEKTGNAGAIYIAGNPDLYPLEYYNSAKGEYEGAVPEIIRQISEMTGIEFVYVSASTVNRQEQLGRNLQVEILTAYTGELGDWCRGDEIVCHFVKDEKEYDARICFTTVLPQKEYELIEDAFYEISDKEICGWAVTYAMKKRQINLDKVFLVVVSILLVVSIVFFVVAGNLYRKYLDEKEAKKWLDPLTARGNKQYYLERFSEMVTDEARPRYYLIFYFFDIDWVNRYISRETAEVLLKRMAAELPEDTENSTYCRTHGGGFTCLIMEDSLKGAINTAKEKIRSFNEIAKEVTGGNKVKIRAVVMPLLIGNCNAESALKYAEESARFGADQQIIPVNDEILKKAIENTELSGQIKSGFERNEFRLLIQPIFDTKTEQLCMGEVLARWDNPVYGRLKPGRFLPLIREMNSIQYFDLYMLNKTCALLQAWSLKGWEGLPLACNVSRISISSKAFIKHFIEVVQRYKFDHSQLYIEITEESLEKNEVNTIENMTILRENGFHIALDDFGTGYTSFMNLLMYQFDIVKIDRELVESLKTDKGKKIVHGIVELAHAAMCKTIIEGIETQEQKDDAVACGCDYIQGFFYARPMMPQDVLKRLLGAKTEYK